jgi:hypothetical protein
MRRPFIQNVATFAIMLGLVTATIGCGSKVDGKYSGADGLFTVELKSGKATLTTKMLGNTSTDTADYTVDGDTVTIKPKGGDMAFKIQKDGSLQGPQGTLTKTAG